MKCKVISLILLSLIIFGNLFSYADDNYQKSMVEFDGLSIEVDGMCVEGISSISEVDYIERISSSKKISIAEASKLNEKENYEIVPFGSDTKIEIRYGTVYGSKTIMSKHRSLATVQMGTEIKYAYNTVLRRPEYIISVGNPHMTIIGGTNSTISGGEYNIEYSNYNGRISRTFSIETTIESSTTIEAGLDVVSVSKSASTLYIITTGILTISMDISLSNLR